MGNRIGESFNVGTIEEDVRELRIVQPKVDFPGNKTDTT